MANMLKIEGKDSLRKDPNNNSVVNIDKSQYNAYKQAKSRILNQKQTIIDLEERLERLENIILKSGDFGE